MAKNQNTFAKRKREMDKKLKAEEKRARRIKRKEEGGENEEPERPMTAAEMHEDLGLEGP